MPEDAASPSPDGASPDDSSSEPWVLRLGNYLTRPAGEKPDDASSTPWTVKLGNYLNERQPGPWSIIANEKPQDPLALRLGTFLNELGQPKDENAPVAEPMVLRLGNYLNGSTGAQSALFSLRFVFFSLMF